MNRKRDHLQMALSSQVDPSQQDRRFIYHALRAPHPKRSHREKELGCKFIGYSMNAPLWISSMTGGTEDSQIFNRRLARCARQFGLGMSLGSCRTLLNTNIYWKDFDLRSSIGNDLPLFANLGIGQIEDLLSTDNLKPIENMISNLQASGLVVHVNLLQEWMQEEGDLFRRSPIETIATLLQEISCKVIVKEVGQGMSREDLTLLMKLPLQGIEFGALGGTNFTLLESRRKQLSNSLSDRMINPAIASIGHTAEDMIQSINRIIKYEKNILVKDFIISGGIKNVLDGYYLMHNLNAHSIFGMAAMFLKYGSQDDKTLEHFISNELDTLHLLYNNFTVRNFS